MPKTYISILFITISMVGTGCSLLQFTNCFIQPSSLTINLDSLPDARLNQHYHSLLTISNNDTPVGAAYIKEGDLPQGINLAFNKHNSSPSITLSGTPTHAGLYSFTLAAWSYGTNCPGMTGEWLFKLQVTEVIK